MSDNERDSGDKGDSKEIDKSDEEKKKTKKKKKIVIMKSCEDLSVIQIARTMVPIGWSDLFRKGDPEIENISRLLTAEIDKYNKEHKTKLKWMYYPIKEDLYNAFRYTSFENTKVVILGQDPYLNKNRKGLLQAMGLSFSVRKGFDIPPSLRNIYNELEANFEDFDRPRHGDLTKWTEEGVLLLNAALTLRDPDLKEEKKKDGKKKKNKTMAKTWTPLIAQVLERLSEKGKVVFMLWGADAHAYDEYINDKNNLLIKCSHPSPFAYDKTDTPFKGSECFKKANEFLISKDLKPIDWNLNDKDK